ncbi:MAG: polar amino acid transport system substrate-binding protein [Kosmotogales bacterium]|jgi:polar amino acid transport system substrate-binding protein|nr:polar amino acid transport system substrate-binding protein [Kosmotogales bacterium]
MKKLLVVSLFVLCIVFALGKTYKVGTEATFPPFEYVENGEIVGFDVDLIKAIAEAEGFDVEFVDMSFDSLIPALVSGNIDIVIAAMTINEERAEVVDFSDPYWTANQSVVVKGGSGKGLTVLFGDNSIGAQTGTTGDLWIEEELQNTGILTGQVKRYESFVLAFTDLENENVDALVLDEPVAERYAKDRNVDIVGLILTNEEYGIAINKDNKALLESINNGLEKLEDSGELLEIVGKYF